ncbi:HlyD family secretion protein [Roseibium alexandrii]|uniref:Multidrug resistance protein MdtN n=1 Tax=Roseibium alexandrii TaxID=388408 RepID=A0A0M7A0N2_9HYPH|nr:HlyD family secretion protein [Roseibium alexandrii]CTQ68157.1 Multidrug resistance protein MdtN [Roseibium alexandrii]
MFEKKFLVVFVSVLFLIFIGNEISRHFFAYTSDAYITSDYASMSPAVAGTLAELHVTNDTEVRKGDPLFTLDQTPYKLAAESAAANVAVSEQALQVAKDGVEEAKTNVTATKAILDDAEATQRRLSTLQESGVVTEQRLDDATRDLAEAQANYERALAARTGAQDQLKQKAAELRQATAEKAVAEYNLDQTVVRAPFDGQVVPFNTKTGQYLDAGDVVLILVSRTGYRIVANVHEQHVQFIKPGQPVYYMVSTAPWVFFKGSVRGISKGIARSTLETQALPYVDPETDWIRLSQRFPVEINLSVHPDDRQAFMGADARVLIWNTDPPPTAGSPGGNGQ